MKTRSFVSHTFIAIGMIIVGIIVMAALKAFNTFGVHSWIGYSGSFLCILFGIAFQIENIRVERKHSRYRAQTDTGENIIVEEVN